MVFACVNGYGGAVDRFLGAPVWQPLGRLSYAVYLLHLPVQLMMAGVARQPFYFNDVTAAYQFWGDLGFTVTLALPWTLLFESPIIGLERMLFGRRATGSDTARQPRGQEPIQQSEAGKQNGDGGSSVIPKTLSLTLQTARL